MIRRALLAALLAVGLTVAAENPRPASAAGQVSCVGNGHDKYRVRFIYVNRTGTPDRYSTLASIFASIGAKTDAVYANSSKPGETRHVRFETNNGNPGCTLDVAKVTVNVPPNISFSDVIPVIGAAMSPPAQPDRKYIALLDWTNDYLCGVASISGNDIKTSENGANYGPQFSVVDQPCWNGDASVEAHELMHNLGGVHNSAPHGAGSHCYDEYDRMCYDADGVNDGVSFGHPLTFTCSSSSEVLFDCGDDDYYNTSPPPGSYLANKWNPATDSVFLIGNPTWDGCDEVSRTDHPADLTLLPFTELTMHTYAGENCGTFTAGPVTLSGTLTSLNITLRRVSDNTEIGHCTGVPNGGTCTITGLRRGANIKMMVSDGIGGAGNVHIAHVTYPEYAAAA